MDKIKIIGGNRLKGEIQISGAKNAALPLIAATLLNSKPLCISNVPALSDIKSMHELLENLGVKITREEEDRFIYDAGDIKSTIAPYDIVKRMRASIVVLGPLLSRFGEAEVSLPGGCAIGARPVDLHIKGLEALGADIKIEDGYIKAKVNNPKGLVGAEVIMEKVSVMATENIMMAATLASGTTTIRNAAREPEVIDLAKFLIKMGAKIKGYGTSEIVIEGVKHLDGTDHKVLPDRIETGTYAIAAAMTGGEIELTNTSLSLLPTFDKILMDAGIGLIETNRGFKAISPANGTIRPVDVSTAPYPGMPTDLQAQTMALMCIADGKSIIKENIFENRFMHVPELNRMGADIKIDGNTATVTGIKRFKGAPVMATDLRASVSLVLAGLNAEGETIVDRVYHLDRGYEKLEEKLRSCGANIERISDTGNDLASNQKPALKVIK